MSTFEREAVRRLVQRADDLGVPVDDTVRSICASHAGTGGAILYARQHPDDDDPAVPDALRYCCEGIAYTGRLDACTCWEAVWEAPQTAAPRPDLLTTPPAARAAKCGDCAYRAGSPERADEWTAEMLQELPARGERFWCHSDESGAPAMLRPRLWRHPAGVEIPGTGEDYQPPVADGGHNRAQIDEDLVAAMLRQPGARAGAVAREVGVSKSVVRRIRDARSIPPAPAGRPAARP